MPKPFAFTVPNLVQGISQQPDAQKDPSQGEIQVNGMSSVVSGLRKREPTKALAKISDSDPGDVFVHSILRDQGEKYLAVIGKTAVRVFTLDGVEKTVSAPAGYGYFSSVVSAKSDIRAVSIADYTFITNTKAIPAMDSASLTPITPRPAKHEALIWVKAANYGQRYNVLVNGTGVVVETAAAAVIVSGTTVTENKISSAEIAEQIKTGLGSVAGVTITRYGSVLYLSSANPITVAATDARANADITAITNSVQAFTELPTIAPKGYQVEVTGDPGNQWDNYFVEFQPRSGQGTFGEGAWKECAGSGSEYRFKYETMPHVLVRLPDGTFYFGPLDGRTVGGITLRKWGERTAGDFRSNPDPSFIGKPINDIFTFRNRLGFLADESVILSRIGSFFDFFAETVTVVGDGDPIDISASGNRVSVLRYAVPAQDELILFSDQTQFRFTSTATTLTPATASVSILTQYEIDIRVRPQQVGTGIVFVQQNGDWSQLREFQLRGNGTSVAAVAPSITDNVASYVPAGVYKITADDATNSLYLISDKDGHKDRVYVYKYLYRASDGGMQKVQSAWSYWQLNGADQVRQVLATQEMLYLITQYGNELWMERTNISDEVTSSAQLPFNLLLDRWVSTETSTPAALRVPKGVYDPATRKTTWTLPYTMRAKTQAWTGPSVTTNGMVMVAEASSGTTLVARGDWSAAPVYFGETYTFRYRFSRFKYMRDMGGGKVASNVLRTQVRKAQLRYHDSGFFKAVVKLERRPDVTYTYDGASLAVRGSLIGSRMAQFADEGADAARYYQGVFTIPIMSRGDRAIVEVENDTAMPCKFSTCEWVGLITGRATPK